jgi:diacylglycerol kinase (ATP)
MPQTLCIILNPASGSTDEKFRDRIEAAVKKLGADFEILETTPDKDATALAREAIEKGCRHLTACGGDGTVMGVVNGIAGKDLGEDDACVLSILPGGTANLLATALQIPSALEDAIAVALDDHERTIDLGKCGDTYFALGLGLGLTERLVSQTSAQQKERLGKLAYALAMLREIGARPSTFVFKLDARSSKRARGVAIVVANAGTVGGKVHFAPRAKIDDGLIDIGILHRFAIRDLIRLIWRSFTGTMEYDRAVSFYQARRVEIRTDPPLDLQVDGELKKLKPPLVAEVVPSALRLRVPRELKRD